MPELRSGAGRAHRRFRRSGGPLLGRVQAEVVCAPPGWRASVACRALCCGGRAAVEGFPWPGRRRGRAGSGAAPLACGWPLRFCFLLRKRKVIPAGPRQGPGAQRPPHCPQWVPPLTLPCSAGIGDAQEGGSKTKNCSDQPRNGQGSVAHVLAHPLFGGHGKPSHPCVSL